MMKYGEIDSFDSFLFQKKKKNRQLYSEIFESCVCEMCVCFFIRSKWLALRPPTFAAFRSLSALSFFEEEKNATDRLSRVSHRTTPKNEIHGPN
jgi:hypothetical protein